LIEKYRNLGIDGWDWDLLFLIEEQQKIIKDLSERVQKLEESIEYTGVRT